MDKFKTALMNLGKELGAFFSSPIVIKNLGGILVTVLVLLFSTFFFLKSCTRHGEQLVVGDFTEMTLKEAIAKANASDFRIVVSDSIDRGKNNLPNTVRSQSPIPFSKVKKNRTIYLTIYKYQRDEVTLPPLTGSDEYARYKRLCSYIEVETRVRERILDRTYAPNTILRIYHEGREIDLERVNERKYKLQKGSVIEMDITEFGDGYAKMPNVVCAQFKEAKKLIESYQLTVGTIKEDPTVVDRSTAYIYQQVPEYNPTQKIPVGRQISLYLTQNQPKDCQSDDSFQQ